MVKSDCDIVFIDNIYRGRYTGETGLLPHGEPDHKDAERAVMIYSNKGPAKADPTLCDCGGAEMDFEQFKMELFTVFSKYQPAIITAYLFGSTAKGLTSPTSDIDIALLLDSNDKSTGATLKFR